MPLFRQLEPTPERRGQKKKKCKNEWTEDEDKPSTLIGLCLQSLAENMKEMWVKDYAQKYMDQYFFRYIIGPFSSLREYCKDLYMCRYVRGFIKVFILSVFLFQLVSCWKSCCASCPRVIC